jgi:hypothetical protein
MAMFVHLTPEKNLKAVLRNGISRLRKRSDQPHGIYAMPVTRNYFISHQWLRELKRRGRGSIIGIYFRVSDDETILVGHYGQAYQQMTAAEAVALIMKAENKEGFEVIIPRRIDAKEIHRFKSIPQIVGWRYYPRANSKKPFCSCSYCQRGNYGARKLRERYEANTGRA